MIRTHSRVSDIRPTVRPQPRLTLADPTYLAMPMLQRLHQRLSAAHRRQHKQEWGVPQTFFFDEAPPPFQEPAWLDDCIDSVLDAVTLLAMDRYSRRMARAIPGFVTLVQELAALSATVRRLADILAVTDDSIVRAIHPEYQCGFRMHVNGIADLQQLHVLLGDVVAGDRSDGLLPDLEMEPGAVEAYTMARPLVCAATVHATYQFYNVDALQPDGTLMEGFAGCDHWLWDRHWLSNVPNIHGERLLLLGPVTVPRSWNAERRVPLIGGEIRLLEVMNAESVRAWIHAQTGHAPVASTPMMCQAA